MQRMLRLQKRFHCLAAEAPLPNMRFVYFKVTVRDANSPLQVKYFALAVPPTSSRALGSVTTA